VLGVECFGEVVWFRGLDCYFVFLVWSALIVVCLVFEFCYEF